MKDYIKAYLMACCVMSLFAFSADARDQIRIVGSSTVFPFSSYAAEEFGAVTDFNTPIVESTGSGGGHKLFSEGVGTDHPDITNSSRPMKLSEFERNLENGVERISEIKIGYDGIAIAHSIDNPDLSLSLKEITLAVAAQVPQDGKLIRNPYTMWNQINPDLPAKKILIYGPPTTSGTRDAFEELVLEVATEEMEAYDGPYTTVRDDGPYIPSGENDNLIVQRLTQDKDAIGIFGYSFLEENSGQIKGASVNGIQPEPDAISTGEYPISRSLFFYVKLAHLDVVPGLEEFVDLFISEKMIGSRGYLKRIGLIPLTKEEREALRERWANKVILKKSDLE